MRHFDFQIAYPEKPMSSRVYILPVDEDFYVKVTPARP